MAFRRNKPISQMDRRAWLAGAAMGLGTALFSGCMSESTENLDGGGVDLVWGKLGTNPGEFKKPRAAAIDAHDNIYLVDMTARIQVFDTDGNYLHGWQTPTHANGRPCGLGISGTGEVMVADTHYSRVLFYTPEGKWLEDRTIGGVRGVEPGQFACVSDVEQDAKGNLYIADFSDADRIQKYSRDGEWLAAWGGTGDAPGKFMRPQSVVADAQGRIWVADACNHRVQVFDENGELLFYWGKAGQGAGFLSYPYCLLLSGSEFVFVCEYGNQRIQKFTQQGEFLERWGSPGRRIGQLDNPWAMVRDSQGRLHVVDSENHRVQRIYFS